MIFPSLHCPVARPGPKVSLRRPALRKLLRVSWGGRHHQCAAAPVINKLDLCGPRSGRAADPGAEAST